MLWGISLLETFSGNNTMTIVSLSNALERLENTLPRLYEGLFGEQFQGLPGSTLGTVDIGEYQTL